MDKAELAEALKGMGLPVSGPELYERFYRASIPLKKGDKGDPGPRGPTGPIAIYISATPPASPQLNQLWLDIS
jgi:hypothetical protein